MRTSINIRSTPRPTHHQKCGPASAPCTPHGSGKPVIILTPHLPVASAGTAVSCIERPSGYSTNTTSPAPSTAFTASLSAPTRMHWVAHHAAVVHGGGGHGRGYAQRGRFIGRGKGHVPAQLQGAHLCHISYTPRQFCNLCRFATSVHTRHHIQVLARRRSEIALSAHGMSARVRAQPAMHVLRNWHAAYRCYAGGHGPTPRQRQRPCARCKKSDSRR